MGHLDVRHLCADNIGLRSLALMTAIFIELDMNQDSPGYNLLPLMFMNTSKYI